MLALTLMVIVTLALARGASSQATATKEAASTEVPAAILALKAAPDLSTARISLEELPESFKEIDTDKILPNKRPLILMGFSQKDSLALLTRKIST